jgi:hypothetical protein
MTFVLIFVLVTFFLTTVLVTFVIVPLAFMTFEQEHIRANAVRTKLRCVSRVIATKHSFLFWSQGTLTEG